MSWLKNESYHQWRQNGGGEMKSIFSVSGNIMAATYGDNGGGVAGIGYLSKGRASNGHGGQTLSRLA